MAARVAGCADLMDIRLFGVAANLETPVVEGGLSYTLSSDVSFQTIGEPVRSVVVTGDYEVAVLDSAERDESSEADDDAPKVADLSFSLAALFSVNVAPDEGEAFGDDEYEAFAATTGQFALYPYAREFISDLTSRMGLPALHIGALRLVLDSRTGD